MDVLDKMMLRMGVIPEKDGWDKMSSEDARRRLARVLDGKRPFDVPVRSYRDTPAGQSPVREQMDPVDHVAEMERVVGWTEEEVEAERTRIREHGAALFGVASFVPSDTYDPIAPGMPLPTREERNRGPKQSDASHDFAMYGLIEDEL